MKQKAQQITLHKKCQLTRLHVTHLLSLGTVPFEEVRAHFCILADTDMQVWTVLSCAHPTEEEGANRHLQVGEFTTV